MKYAELSDILARDTRARRECGLPAPSYNNMKGLNDVQRYSEVEEHQVWKRLILDDEMVAEVLTLSKTRTISSDRITNGQRRQKFSAPERGGGSLLGKRTVPGSTDDRLAFKSPRTARNDSTSNR